ncbi:head protein [Yersinia phage vB_YenM_P778]
MAGTLNETTKNKLLTSLNVKTIKLHSDAAGDGTANTVAGAEATLTMGTATGGVIASTGSANIPVTIVSGAITVKQFSLWDSASSPVCVATGDLSSNQTFSTTGTYVVNSLSVDLNK